MADQAVLISTTASGLIARATKLIQMETNVARGFRNYLQKLLETLVIIQHMSHDAENWMIRSPDMMVWRENLMAIICHAENVLDELAYEALRRKIEVRYRMAKKVRDFFSLSNPLSFCLGMVNKVNDINLRLDELREEASAFGLRQAEQLTGSITPRELSTTTPWVDDTKVVGRNGDTLKVVNMLLGSDIGHDLPIIAIVGMGGLGKTTLAHIVYKQEKVTEYFNERIWICASDKFTLGWLLNEMVQSLTGFKSETQNIQGAVKKLLQKLHGKKYLLVLDDVWNMNESIWVDLRNSLIGVGGSKESKILVTTRSMEVVKAMQTSMSCTTYKLTELSYDDCWTMFRKIAFACGGPSETQTLLDIGGQMVKECKGVPLAINALGGLMHTKHDELEWEFIKNSEIWSSREINDGILPVLRLSFDHLPSPSLKQSFAYCSIFPKDHVIIKDELIQLWMSLGYLQLSSRSEVEMEELGNEYFNILLLNSLFQEVEFDEYNNTTSCKMHDLVHDLAVDLSRGNCLTLEGSEVNCYPTGKIQHMSLFLRQETELDISRENVAMLRTLFLKGHLPKTTKIFKRIRALRLIESCVEELPIAISKSIHLRFLDISESSIVKVPNFITKLYNLETLKLPRFLKELPKDFHNLVSLRHFHLADTDENRKLMPKNIGQLKSLQTLPFFVVGRESGHRIEELGKLTKLRGTLHVYDLQHVKDKAEATEAEMSGKSGIQELGLHWDRDFEILDNKHEDVLEGLKPHRNVKGLILANFGGKTLASWLSSDACLLQNLVKIELRDCKLCEQVPALGHLPHLAFVKMDGLHNLKRIGPKFYGLDDGNCRSSGAPATRVFPALREFKLTNMPLLCEWSGISSDENCTITTEFFPRLQKLFIARCPKLITIPCHLLSIQKLVVMPSSTYHHEQEMTYSPTLQIVVDKDYEDIAILLEGLLQGSEKSIREMAIKKMNWLIYLPNQLQNLASLEKLEISLCRNLMGPIDKNEAASNVLTSLQQLSIRECPELACLPQWLLQPTLVDIQLYDCQKLKMQNSDALGSLESLERLEVVECPKLGSCWKEGWVHTTNLQSLAIGCFTGEFRYFPWPSTNAASPPKSQFTSLKSLILLGWPDVKSLPDQLEHLPSLRDLMILRFWGLESVPGWLSNLPSLQSLVISGCPLLKKRCKKGIGEDWHKIAHIPSIQIDEETV